jgi:ubiquinone/menaquinone biosynthesis C-methylase UbiE
MNDYHFTHNSSEKERIARGYDDLATDSFGMNEAFHVRCVRMHRRYYGRVADIGCGAGRLIQKLNNAPHDEGTEFYGLDISHKLCEVAQQKNPYARIVQGDAEALPYEDNFFDFVFMTETLEHMLDSDKALSEVHRVLKPGGIFIFTVPNRDWASFDFYDRIRNKSAQPIDDHYFRVAEIKEYLRKNSFKIVSLKGSENLFYYEPYHKFEQFAALFLPFLHTKMKRLHFKCVVEK